MMSRTADSAPQPGLLANAISLPGAIMQSITTMSPAVSVAFTVPFLASTSGLVSPLAVLCSAVVSYLLGYSLSQLTRHMRSAGSYQSFVRVLVGSRWGFMVAWVYLLFYPIAAAMLCGLIGSTLHQILQSEYNFDLPWWLPMIILIAIIGSLAYLGVKIATEVIVALGVIEIVIMLALAIWGLADPGPGGTSLSWVYGAHWPGGHAFFLGFVFSIYNLTGWDAAATLGEETANPLRNIPRAVLGSIIVMAAFVVITTWGELTGWGTADLAGFLDSKELPIFALAHKYWGGLWIIALIALMNSIAGAALACTNAASRVIFDMARIGALPRSWSRTGKHKTPVVAIMIQTAINLGIGLLMIAKIGLYNVFNFTGLMFVFALLFVYVLGNVAVWRMYRTTARSEFNVIKHVAIPVVGTAALILVAYESLNPAPPSPLNWALPTVLIWFAIGAIVLAVRGVRGDNGWLSDEAEDSVPVSATGERAELAPN